MSKKGGKAQAQTKDQSYDVRDVVLAKVRGYPPWPAMIVDPDTVPENVQNERPNAKTKKGNWYCVRFFPAGDYAWIVPKDISKLQQHEIEAYINEPYKRSGDLLQGYRIALDPTKWEEEREARRVEAAEEEANAEIDQLESDGEEEADDGEEKKVKSRKRKRESDAAVAKKAKAKPKKGSAEPASKKRAGSAKGKKNGIKSRAMVESEDEGGAEPEDEEAGPSKQASPPPAKKTKREKEGEEEVDATLNNDPEAQKVRDWRHKLQKAFLNNKNLPKDDDMPALDQLFSTVENYENMNIQYLSFSKIGKVMRHIHALTPDKVPRDEEFKFRERAKALVDRWHDILNANKPNGTSTESAKATTNGTSPPAKAAEAADAGSTTNGKQESEEPSKVEVVVEVAAEGEENAMEVDATAKVEEPPAETAPAAPESGDAEADGEAETADDAPADPAADESALADVTMSEAAA